MNDQAPRTCRPTSFEPPPLARDRAEEREFLAAWCKALAHPARVRILELLLARETCICGDLVDELELAQSTVSQHLKVLKEAGLIQGSIDGPRMCYYANRAALDAVFLAVARLRERAVPLPETKAP